MFEILLKTPDAKLVIGKMCSTRVGAENKQIEAKRRELSSGENTFKMLENLRVEVKIMVQF